MKGISSTSAAELLSRLGQMEIVVLPRGQRRTKEQVENWVRRTVLACYAESEFFSYPLMASPNDRPDLDITLPGRSIGVEITEAVPNAYAAAIVHGQRHFPNAVIDRSMFTWEQTQMTGPEYERFFQKFGSQLRGQGWSGDAVEREWADAIFYCINKKIADLNKEGFRTFPEYWLAIYDNFEGPALDLDLATSLLKGKLSSLASGARNYTRFLIESGKVLVSIESGGATHQMKTVEFQ